MEQKLRAESRTEAGKGPARRLRAHGEIPAVLYGSGIEPHPLKVKREDVSDVLRSEAGSNVLIDLQITDGKDKENHLVMIKEIQRHPFKERVLHVDFLKVARDEMVTMKVPIAVNGEEESVGLKAGGTLQHNLREVDVECLPGDVPDHLYADITEAAIGDHLRVSDLEVPPGVTVLTEPEDAILSILAPRLLEKEEIAELEEEAAAGEEIPPAEEKPAEAAPTPGEE